jgi:hypothetical protein
MPGAEPRVTIVDSGGRRRAVPLDSYLDPASAEAAESGANRWIKQLRHARVDGTPLRERLTYRGDSLWWFVEIYLHKQRTIASAYRAIAALEALAARERPRAMVSGTTPLLQLLVPQAARRHALGGRQGAAVPERVPLAAHLATVVARSALVARGYLHTIAALADRLRPGATRARPDRHAAIVAFVHSAFWRSDRAEEGYLGPVLRALDERVPHGDLALVGLGPRTNFRMRRWRHRLAEFSDPLAEGLPFVPIELLAGPRAIRPSMSVWGDRARTFRSLAGSDDVRRAAIIDGYDLWPVIRDDLLGVAHLQLPWSARSMDEAGAALDALHPRVVLTYAEAGGWGRALTLEARRRRILVVGLQHGFIYRHWLNYLHEPDEMHPSAANRGDCGYPCPDLTLVHDAFARQHLLGAGHFAPASVAVTGSPRLEAFSEAGRRLTPADRAQVRAGVGALPGQKLVVLATKYTQVSSWFQPLVEAFGAMPGAHLVVKCHPAEGPGPYERVADAAPNVRVAGPGTDLAALVACADLIVTVNSTAAVEAMSLDVPGLVLALPNNLSPFVEAGALAGIEHLAQIGPAVGRLLYDQEARDALRQQRQAFIERYDIVSKGGAAQRAAERILELAGSPTPLP